MDAYCRGNWGSVGILVSGWIFFGLEGVDGFVWYKLLEQVFLGRTLGWNLLRG